MKYIIDFLAKEKQKEFDFEQMIFAEWDDFETLFLSETERLSNIFEKYLELKENDLDDPAFWYKTLPRGHKEFKK